MTAPRVAAGPARWTDLSRPLILPLLGSVLAWGLLFVAFPPDRQNFPLNDDWAFARGAFQFARGEGIHYGSWASMPQLGQWLWACPFLWLFGFSHVVLRVSTLVLSWLGLAAFYDLLRQEDVTPRQASLATAALAFNPLFFLLQGTFMTDVPALALALCALALYGRALRRAGVSWLAGACAVAILAVTTRQNTAAVLLTAGVMLARQPVLRRRPLWWLGVLLPVVVAGAVHVWFQGRSDIRPLELTGLPWPVLALLPFLVVHFCGLSAFPLQLLDWQLRPRLPFVLAGLFLAGWACWLFYSGGHLFPYMENLLTPWGAFAGAGQTGPLVWGERPRLLGGTARAFLTLLGCLAGAVLVERAVQQWRPGAWARPLLLFTLFQLPFLLIVSDLYDRYLLFLLPGALALAVPSLPSGKPEQKSQIPWLPSVGVLVVLAVVSVGLMHDWLAWNSARWDLGRRAVAQGIDPQDIEGGVEWDGWYAPPGEEPPPSRGPRGAVLPFTREWFPAIRGRYVLSFSPDPRFVRRASEPYTLWLLPGRREFWLLEVPLPGAASGKR
jgi:hypothetical protein